jgi:hypothetical protein
MWSSKGICRVSYIHDTCERNWNLPSRFSYWHKLLMLLFWQITSDHSLVNLEFLTYTCEWNWNLPSKFLWLRFSYQHSCCYHSLKKTDCSTLVFLVQIDLIPNKYWLKVWSTIFLSVQKSYCEHCTFCIKSHCIAFFKEKRHPCTHPNYIDNTECCLIIWQVDSNDRKPTMMLRRH